MVIDAHRHFWHYNTTEFGWIADTPLKRDFLPEDCGGMDACVAVEARQCAEETDWLLSLAAQHSFIKGVVGWLPIVAPDISERIDAVLAANRLQGRSPLVGLRHVVQDEPDDSFILRPDFIRGVRLLLERGLTYDILVFERHLPNTMRFVDALPDDARLVLDHLGKPREFVSWRRLVRELAERENVFCKFSGLVTELAGMWNGDPHRFDELAEPYLETALEAFGPRRLMFGSDWPVVTVHLSYGVWRGVVERFAAKLSEAERNAVMGGNAMAFYKFPLATCNSDSSHNS